MAKTAKTPPADRLRAEALPEPSEARNNNRSALSNGTRLFLGETPVHRQSAIARRFADHLDDLEAQMGGDLSPTQQMLARRIATLSVAAEMDETKLAAGLPVDMDAYARRATALTTLICKFGLGRSARDVTPGAVIDSFARAVRDAEGGAS